MYSQRRDQAIALPGENDRGECQLLKKAPFWIFRHFPFYICSVGLEEVAPCFAKETFRGGTGKTDVSSCAAGPGSPQARSKPAAAPCLHCTSARAPVTLPCVMAPPDKMMCSHLFCALVNRIGLNFSLKYDPWQRSFHNKIQLHNNFVRVW